MLKQNRTGVPNEHRATCTTLIGLEQSFWLELSFVAAVTPLRSPLTQTLAPLLLSFNADVAQPGSSLPVARDLAVSGDPSRSQHPLHLGGDNPVATTSRSIGISPMRANGGEAHAVDRVLDGAVSGEVVAVALHHVVLAGGQHECLRSLREWTP